MPSIRSKLSYHLDLYLVLMFSKGSFKTSPSTIINFNTADKYVVYSASFLFIANGFLLKDTGGWITQSKTVHLLLMKICPHFLKIYSCNLS